MAHLGVSTASWPTCRQLTALQIWNARTSLSYEAKRKAAQPSPLMNGWPLTDQPFATFGHFSELGGLSEQAPGRALSP